MAWQSSAACRGMDPALFFPTRGQDTRTIKAVCAECPVSAECLEVALEVGWAQDHGIFGGTTAKERRRLRRARSASRCGTDAGYMAHRARGQEPCEDCRAGHREAERTRRARRTA